MIVIPSDRAAEAIIVGCAVATVHGAALAGERLAATDFYWPAHGHLFLAAVDLTDVDIEQDRIAVCAARAELDEAVVTALVRSRSVMFDTTGSYARRVVEAARRRRLMSICEVAYRRIGEGGTVEDALSVLQAAS